LEKMDPRLQQAINAARAGYNEAAQILLADALQENPQDTGAWFLLAHLVESNERQARYLEQTLLLDPDNELAKQQLERLQNPGVPAPVIKAASSDGPISPFTTPPPTINSGVSGIAPAKTNPVLIISSNPELASGESDQQAVVEQNSSRIDSDWQKTAPPPKRASNSGSVSPVRQEAVANTAVIAQTASQTTATESKKEPVNKWLLTIFIILVALAAVVIAYLAYTVIF
jgi:hypothetical protein